MSLNWHNPSLVGLGPASCELFLASFHKLVLTYILSKFISLFLEKLRDGALNIFHHGHLETLAFAYQKVVAEA